MEVQTPIETEDCILLICHLISANIKFKYKDNLVSAVDAHNETILVNGPNIDKEHLVLEGDDLQIQVGAV